VPAHRVTPGLQATHVEFKHAVVIQSASFVQPPFTAHAGQVPPQSTSVSNPFLMVSPQAAPAHFPPEQ
jgi:hypothetical protein